MVTMATPHAAPQVALPYGDFILEKRGSAATAYRWDKAPCPGETVLTGLPRDSTYPYRIRLAAYNYAARYGFKASVSWKSAEGTLTIRFIPEGD